MCCSVRFFLATCALITDPVKMITPNPAILSCAVDSIRGKFANLRELGFADPVKMISSNPAIPSYAVENIRSKIIDLRELGFSDPVKMITSLPAILGYAIDSIRGKVDDLHQLGFADPIKMITSLPAIMGYARERLLLCGRIVMQLDEDGTDRMFAQLIKQPRAAIEAVAATQPRTWSEIRAIISAAKKKAES
jgi:hypothetical protein